MAFWKNKRVVGIVGGIACGKSTITSYLKKIGAVVLDADWISHQVLMSPFVLEKIRVRWGLIPSVNVAGEKEFRSKIAKIVFKSSEDLLFLENLLHPIVRQRIGEAILANGNGIIILDAPLLFEADCAKFCDEVWFVNMPWGERLHNFSNRYNGKKMSEIRKDFMAREGRQMPLAEKMKRSDFVIRNSFGFLYETLEDVAARFNKIKNELFQEYQGSSVVI